MCPRNTFLCYHYVVICRQVRWGILQLFWVKYSFVFLLSERDFITLTKKLNIFVTTKMSFNAFSRNILLIKDAILTNFICSKSFECSIFFVIRCKEMYLFFNVNYKFAIVSVSQKIIEYKKSFRQLVMLFWLRMAPTTMNQKFKVARPWKY